MHKLLDVDFLHHGFMLGGPSLDKFPVIADYTSALMASFMFVEARNSRLLRYGVILLSFPEGLLYSLTNFKLCNIHNII